MIVRQVDINGDWTFGQGRNNYLRANAAVVQNVATRLRSFLGDCFFDLTAGIDWFNLLGGGDQLALSLAVSAVILNTDGITQLTQLSISTDPTTRAVTITYAAVSVYSAIQPQTVQFTV